MTTRLRIGIQLPEVEREVRWPEYAAMARAAEEVGFDSIWVGDHLLYRDAERGERGPWEAWTLLAGLAAVTQRVQIGPLVACAGFHPPAMLAKQAATVDEISGGRLLLGLGAGWNETEFRAFGLPFDRRVSRFEESFEIVRRLLDGERVSFQGRFHSVEEAVLLPPPRRSPPLVIGSNGPRMLGIALPHADAWNTWWLDYGNAPEGFAELNETITAAAREAGRDPAEVRRTACVLVTTDPSREERPRRPEAPPVALAAVPDHLRAMAAAGADAVILVADPIDEQAIRQLGEAVAKVR